MAKLDIPSGPGGDAAMVWSMRPELGAMVQRMIQGAYEQSIVPDEEREMARMRIAQINGCELCLNYRAASVQEAAIPPEQYLNVADYRTCPDYTDRQRLAIEFAELYATDHAALDDAFFVRLRERFSDEEILDLSLCVGVFIAIGRTLAVLGIVPACAVAV
jgi:alkylhydroperoxidase family enzyme